MFSNLHWSSCTVPVILSDFNESWIFVTHSRKILQYKIWLTSLLMRAELFHADGQMGGPTDGRRERQKGRQVMTKLIVVLTILRKRLKIRCKIQKLYRSKFFQYNTKKIISFVDITCPSINPSQLCLTSPTVDLWLIINVFMLRHNPHRNPLISSSPITYILPMSSHSNAIILVSL
jgi:hypothetical protein